jgi:hypothetical protein
MGRLAGALRPTPVSTEHEQGGTDDLPALSMCSPDYRTRMDRNIKIKNHSSDFQRLSKIGSGKAFFWG